MSGEQDTPFRDAEEWLARQGIEREPIRVTPPQGPPPSAREAQRLAQATAAQPQSPTPAEAADAHAGTEAPAHDLGVEVAKAVAYIRRATSSTPMSEGRLRDKLAGRDHPDVVIDHALRRARDERLVDDRAMASALIDERRAKGHAPVRLRADLRKRGFDDRLIDELLAPIEDQDQEAVAFDVARQRADRYGALEAEAAFRRLTGYLARRGFPEWLCRKVAREVIFAARRDREAAER